MSFGSLLCERIVLPDVISSITIAMIVISVLTNIISMMICVVHDMVLLD